jgi:glyoxylase-like metal-dependent hydrolase (beta-lactamase superfamily II)
VAKLKLSEKLYWFPYRGSRNTGNTCIFKGDMNVLVDPGHLFNLGDLTRSIVKDGLNPRDIDLIILSHGHPDHCEATSKLQELTGARVAMHRLEEHCLSKYTVYGRIPGFSVDFHLADQLDMGSITLQILHTPGHTPGSVSLYWSERGVLLTGDVVFYRGLGRGDLYGGDIQALKRSIELLSKLDVEYLLPGHHYGFPPSHIGLIKGREEVENNFEYLKRVFW